MADLINKKAIYQLKLFMKKNFLVTTGLVDALEFEEKNFPLGKWCEFYELNDFDDEKFNSSSLYCRWYRWSWRSVLVGCSKINDCNELRHPQLPTCRVDLRSPIPSQPATTNFQFLIYRLPPLPPTSSERNQKKSLRMESKKVA